LVKGPELGGLVALLARQDEHIYMERRGISEMDLDLLQAELESVEFLMLSVPLTPWHF
jgi:hypothetical protein